jgi:hypothetical protein
MINIYRGEECSQVIEENETVHDEYSISRTLVVVPQEI